MSKISSKAVRLATPRAALLTAASAVSLIVGMSAGSHAFAQQVDEVVVTAERREMQLQDTPLSIIALSGATLENKGIQNVSDLMLVTPNLAIQPGRFSGTASPTYAIRGVSGGGGAAGERGVSMYVDGVYQPRTVGTLMKIFDLDRVEVLRGPQGTLFGRNSTGGAIRLFTKQPSHEFDAYVRGTYGNFDHHDLIGMVNMPIGDKFAVRAQAGWLHENGYVKRGPERLGGSDDKVARLQAKWDPTSNLSVVVGAAYSRTRAGGNPQVLAELDLRPGIEGFVQGNYGDWLNDSFKKLGGPPIAPFNDPRVVSSDPYTTPGFCFLDNFNPDYSTLCKQFENTDYLMGDAKIVWNLNDKTTITSTTGYGSLIDRSLTDSVLLGFSLGTSTVKSKTLNQEVQLNTKLFADRVDLVVGGNYFSEHSSSGGIGSITRRGTSVYPAAANGDGDGGLFYGTNTSTRNTAKSYGFFGSTTIHVTTKFNVTGGLRYGHDEKGLNQNSFASATFIPVAGTDRTTVTTSHAWHALDWRMTLDYHFTDDAMVYGTVSKAYKAGAYSFTILSNVAGPLQSGDFIKPIPPEQVINYEIGARTTWFGNRLRINPTIYFMRWGNRQAPRQIVCTAEGLTLCPTGFRIMTVNSGNIDLKGMELDGQVAITRDFNVDFSAGVTKYKLRDPAANGGPNLYPAQASPTFNIGGTYAWHLGNRGDVSGNINWSYINDMPTYPDSNTDSSYQLPSYDVLNARLTWRPSNRKFSVSLFANNLTDNVYATYASSAGGGFWDAGGLPNPADAVQFPLRRALGKTMARPREFGLTAQYNF